MLPGSVTQSMKQVFGEMFFFLFQSVCSPLPPSLSTPNIHTHTHTHTHTQIIFCWSRSIFSSQAIEFDEFCLKKNSHFPKLILTAYQAPTMC